MARAEKAEAARLTMDILDDLEEEIELLKVAYERYFNGVDRIPPRREHDAVKLHLRNIERMRGGVTALRFRTQTLKARIVTYEHYWTRILRQIEQGTFKRLLAVSQRREHEAKRRRVEEEGLAAAQSGVRTVVDPAQSGIRTKLDRDANQSGTRAKLDRSGAAAKPASGRTPSSRQLPDGVGAQEARDLFKQFVAAKKAAGESVNGLTYGRLIDKLAREVPKLQKKHGDEIRFEVDTSGGKVRLRARKRSSDQKAS